VTNIELKKISLWVRLLPVIFFIGYLNLTVFLFAFGPWDWPVKDGTKLYVFLAFAHAALFLGYLSAAFSKPGEYYGRFKVQHIVIVSLVVNLLLLLPTSAFRTGSAIPNIVAGLANPGEVYRTTNEIRGQGGGIAEYVRIVLSPIIALLIPLTFYYWGNLKPFVRYLSVFSMLFFLAIYVAIGTNKAIADFVLIVPCLVLARHLSGRLKLGRRRIIIASVLAMFAFGLFFSFFSAGQISRAGSTEGAASLPILDIKANLDNFIVRPLPDELKVPAVALISYLTQGYYGLYLSLEKPFVPMFGVGNSMFLYFNASKITGMKEIENMPYPIRIGEDGWDGYGQWSTIYPWIASDVSFAGTILVVFLIGYFFALSWIDTLKGTNPYAVAVFAQFLIMLFYFSANNQVMGSGEALFGFYGLLLMWLYTRRKYVWRTR
jgi:hypothetical protein